MILRGVFFNLISQKKTILCCSYDPQISNISIYIDTPGKTFDIQIKYPVGIYMSKVNNRNPRTRCEIYSKLTIKNLNDAKRRFGVFIVNIWTYFTPCSSVSVINFEQVNASLDSNCRRLDS